MNKPYNIVFLVTACKKSGPIQQMLSIFTYMDRNTFHPILVTLYDEPTDRTSQLQKYIDIGVEHYQVPISKMDVLLGRTGVLKKKLEELNPAIVHSLGVFPDYALSSMRFPNHVITLRNYVYEDYPVKFGKAKGTVLVKMHLYAMKHTDQTWTCSESLSRQYENKLGLKFSFIRNGVSVSQYHSVDENKKTELRVALGLPADKKIFVYAGQFIARKDQRFLLELFKDSIELKDKHFVLLGDGNDFDSLKSEFGNLANVLMPGSVYNVNEYLQASDIYIASSKSEGLPNGVLEAMATGLPVILSNIEQHKEVYEANTSMGRLYKLGDKVDCLNQILALLDSDLKFRGHEAYKCAHEVFSAERMSNNYQKEYLKIIENTYVNS